MDRSMWWCVGGEFSNGRMGGRSGMRYVISIDREDCVLVFFFFQAEDGIRDYKVTGVQTCALPILLDPADAGASFRHKKTARRRFSRSLTAHPLQTADGRSHPCGCLIGLGGGQGLEDRKSVV